jgi:hypothetical protein
MAGLHRVERGGKKVRDPCNEIRTHDVLGRDTSMAQADGFRGIYVRSSGNGPEHESSVPSIETGG